MDRAAATLSGGEAQRIRLATQIGSALVGVLYVLDEPSIGLHQRDNSKLIGTLERLRDLGNTVLVVEHDEQTMRAADHLVDLGPGAGEHGGRVVAAGHARRRSSAWRSRSPASSCPGRARSRCPRSAARPRATSRSAAPSSTTCAASTCRVPLGVLTCVTGVSGSGKSTLVNEVLYKAVANRLHRARQRAGAHTAVLGLDQLDKIIQVDQSPIGRTPRSNPATYTGLFDVIRDLFSKTPEARARGYKPGRFSFNVKGGRCEVCRGDGQIKIEMHFLPDVYVPCEQCHGKRYNRETLDIRFKGKTIADVLDMPVEEAVEFFDNIPKIRRRLETLNDVGLGYIRLGQPATTLSGGEAQRVKLATELSKIATGRTLYILDEPTTGLHFADVQRLLEVLQRLVDAGQLRRRDRAQPRRHQDRRPAHRHGSRGRRGGRHGRRLRARRRRSPRTPGSHTGAFLRRAGDAGGAEARAARRRRPAGQGRRGGLSAAGSRHREQRQVRERRPAGRGWAASRTYAMRIVAHPDRAPPVLGSAAEATAQRQHVRHVAAGLGQHPDAPNRGQALVVAGGREGRVAAWSRAGADPGTASRRGRCRWPSRGRGGGCATGWPAPSPRCPA